MLSYTTLQSTFYGTWNLDIPTEMLDIFNPDEIIARTSAAADLKRRNKHLEGNMPTDCYGLINLLDKSGYKYAGRLRSVCKRPYSRKKGELKKAIEGLDASVQQAFVDSFYRPYRPSNTEAPTNPKAFADPNIDGRSKRVYAERIYLHFESKWVREKERIRE